MRNQVCISLFVQIEVIQVVDLKIPELCIVLISKLSEAAFCFLKY